MHETNSKANDLTKFSKTKNKSKKDSKERRKREKSRQRQKETNAKRKNQENIDALLHYDLSSYDDDIDVMASIFNIRRSRKDWITITKMDLQSKANKYEHLFGNFLLKHDVHFIHQAPFVIDGNIYFADFYIPEKRIIIEIDGGYHDSKCQKEKDRKRTKDLKFAGTKVVRIKNATTMDDNILMVKCKINGIL